jgi:C1A family cysteine protease
MSRPVSVAVDGNNFSRYSSGIFDNCGKSISIAVLLVGATDQYYKLKNSWGTAWGEQGYIRITRVYDSCGICEYASYPNPL